MRPHRRDTPGEARRVVVLRGTLLRRRHDGAYCDQEKRGKNG
jgi:hypothetical protein